MDFVGEKCPFCENIFEENDEIVICSVCKTPHHVACWNANNGCTSYACKGIPLSYEESVKKASEPIGYIPPIVVKNNEEVEINKSYGSQFDGFFDKISENRRIDDVENEIIGTETDTSTELDSDLLSIDVPIINDDNDNNGTEQKKEENQQMINNTPKNEMNNNSLIPCPDCGNPISIHAPMCPKCGRPMISESEKKNKKTKVKKIKEHNPKKKKIIILISSISVAIVLLAICAGIVLYLNSTPKAKYQKAEKAFASGNYEKAIEYYTLAGDYEDSRTKLENAELVNHYYKGVQLFEEENYADAKEEFLLADNYEDAISKAKECDYQVALGLKGNKQYSEAAQLFHTTLGYQDSNDQILEMGDELVIDGKYDEALSIYANAATWMNDQYAQYANGKIAYEKNDYMGAADYFKKAGTILNAHDMYWDSQYKYGQSVFKSGDYTRASTIFSSISSYSDSNDMVNACSFMLAKGKMSDGYLNESLKAFKALPSNYSYNGTSVKSMIDKIEESKWLDICGNWENTSGEASSNCKARNYSWDGGTWTNTFDPGDYKLDIKCKMNSDGTVTLDVSGTIMVLTSWSTVSIGVDYDKNHSVSFNKRVSNSDFGKEITIDNNTTIKLENNKITLNYVYNDNNSSSSFIYKYKTKVTYSKKTSY